MSETLTAGDFPLPEPIIRRGEGGVSTWDKFNAAQMRAFAAQHVAAERERCQRVCQSMSFEFGADSPERDVLQRVATRLDMPEHDPSVTKRSKT